MSSVNNYKRPLKVSVTGGNGNYTTSAKSEISISGSAGFGIKAFDLINNSYNKSSVFSIELRIDSVLVYNYRMNEFAFNESRYINSHIDYEALLKENSYIERAYLLPNDKLSVYQNLINKGIFSFGDGKKHHIEITVSDIYKNRSKLSFSVNSLPPSDIEDKDKTVSSNTVVMPYNRNNKFISGNVTVNIPAGTLYDTLYFEFNRSSGKPGMYSDIYQIHNKYTPVNRAYDLSIKPDRIPPGKTTKLMIVMLEDNMKGIPVSGTWDNGRLIANPRSFGTFYIGIDTMPPQINLSGFKSDDDLSGRTELKIKISDDFSGIKTYEPEVDGKWALFEYDQKNNVLIYRFDPKRIKKGSKHSLSLRVADNRDNISTSTCEFIW
jgi:hypothetical protein